MKLKMYESEFTRFINELKQKTPQIAQGQAQGLAILWEKDPIDLDWAKRAKESRVRQRPYVYQGKL